MDYEDSDSISELDDQDAEPSKPVNVKLKPISSKGLFEIHNKSKQQQQQRREQTPTNGAENDTENGMDKKRRKNEMMKSIADDKRESLDEDYDSSSSAVDLSAMEKFKDLNDLLQKKNNQIKELLEDLQASDEENKTLRTELTHVKDKLTEATYHIQEQTLYIKNNRTENVELIEQIQYLKKSEAALQSQIIDLTETNKSNERNMDEFILQMDSRIIQWKEILNDKESDIKHLNTEIFVLEQKLLTVDQKDPEYFNQIIEQRDLQINELQEKLIEATNNLTTSTRTIEELRRQCENVKLGFSRESLADNSTIIEHYKSNLRDYEIKCEDLEESLKLKEKELTETLEEINNPINGDSRSNDVLQNSRKHKQQIKVRDDHIKKLITENNKLTRILDKLQMENSLMRKKLNLPPEQSISTNNILTKYERKKKDYNDIFKQKLNADEQIVSLRIRLRQKEKTVKKIYEYVKSQGIKLPEHFLAVVLSEENSKQAFDSDSIQVEKRYKRDNEIQRTQDENDKMDDKIYKSFSDENDSNYEETKSIIDTENEDLDKFIPDSDNELWNHSIVKLLIELKAENVNINNLRDMLKKAKEDTISTLKLLAEESQKNIDLKRKLQISSKGSDSKDSLDGGDDVFQVDSKSYVSILHKNLQHFHKQFETLYDNMTEIYSLSSAERESWASTEEQYKNKIQELTMALESTNRTRDDFKPIQDVKTVLHDMLEQLSTGVNNTDINQNSKSDPNGEFLYEILYKKFYYERRSAHLEELLKTSRCNCRNVKAEYHQYKMDSFEKIKRYEIELQKSMFDNIDLRHSLKNSVPYDAFLKQNIKLNDFSMKYRKILNKTIRCNCDASIDDRQIVADNDEESLKAKIALLEEHNLLLQENQNELINKFHSSWPNESDLNGENASDVKSQYENVKIENLNLHLTVQKLEQQVHYYEQKKLSEDLEVNILNHQILDLQSANDNKAIVAKLSGEILVSHLHKSSVQEKNENLLKELALEREKSKKLLNIVNEKDVQFDNYVTRSNFKICFLSNILQVLREQYQNSIPLVSIEHLMRLQTESKERLKHIRKTELELNCSQETKEANLITETLLNIKNNSSCVDEKILKCPHYIELEIKASKWERDTATWKLTYGNLEKTHLQLEKKFEELQETLLLLTFSLDNGSSNNPNQKSSLPYNMKRTLSVVEVTDVDENDTALDDNESQKPVPKPRKIIKTSLTKKSTVDNESGVSLPGSPLKFSKNQPSVTAIIQTDALVLETVECQTNPFPEIQDKSNERSSEFSSLSEAKSKMENELKSTLLLVSEKSKIILSLETEKIQLQGKIDFLENIIQNKDKLINEFHSNEYRHKTETIKEKRSDEELEKLKDLLDNLKTMEASKNSTIAEYKELLKAEKIEHNQTNVLAQKQIIDMKSKMDALEMEYNGLKDLLTKPSHIEAYNITMEKYRNKLLDLEEKCFQLQHDLDHEHAALVSSKSECERWKNLAAERLANIESLKKHFESKHCEEIASVKAENNHWLAEIENHKDQLSECKIQSNEFKTVASKQIDERNIIIEGLYSYNCSLKQKLLQLQTIISANDPTFDLTSIIEVDEETNKSETTDRQDFRTDTMIERVFRKNDLSLIVNNKLYNNWPETVVEKLRREKQLVNKQNAMLRKQLKILGARERRAKLEAQNIKSQMSKGHVFNQLNKNFPVSGEEVIMLHRKIEMLELELADKNSNIDIDSNKNMHLGLWEKQKKWQENSERWKQKYYEKCAEYEKLQRNFEGSRIVVQRLERDKRILDSRLSKHSREGLTPSTITGESEGHLELLLQDKERLEDEVRTLKNKLENNIKHSSLLEKLESQQRRIVAYELLEKGKDALVNEYEKLLAQNTLLAKQNIKLETEILENQFVNAGKRLEPDGSDGESNCCRRMKQQNQHLENYIKILKEENSQLISKSIEKNSINNISPTTPTVGQAKRIANLEKTVLTLRGLVSKLQTDNKRLTITNAKLNKVSSAQAQDDMLLENLKQEIEQMRDSIKDKDELLHKAKELLKRAADKEKLLYSEIKQMKEKQR